jgi:putative acetyltransferase
MDSPNTWQAFRLAPRHEDVETLADLWVASWQSVMPAIDFAARRDWFCDLVTSMEADGALTICAFDRQNALAGFMLLHPGRAYLEQMAVQPALFGNGVGALLIGEAKRLCPHGLDLHVNTDNPRALRFYEELGFERQESGLNPNSGLKTWRVRWPGQAAGPG